MVDVVAYGTGHGGGAAGRQGGRQDRHRRARGHARPRDRRGAAAGRRLEHRRLVHGLRARRGGREIAVAVLLVRAGAGGATAAPAARVVLGRGAGWAGARGGPARLDVELVGELLARPRPRSRARAAGSRCSGAAAGTAASSRPSGRAGPRCPPRGCTRRARASRGVYANGLSARQRLRLELVVLVVLDLEVVGRRALVSSERLQTWMNTP